MTTEKAIDKIRKLLALAESDNAGEAENALLAARKLMAEHKLTERDVADANKPGKLNKRVYEKHTFSALKNGWMIDLSKVIAENHCCAMCANGRQGSTVNRVMFVGLDDDPDIAMTLFDYAVDHIHHMVSLFRREVNALPSWLSDRQHKNQRVRVYENSYAAGFVHGLETKYREQFVNEQGEVTETALVLVQPKEVTDFQDTLKSKTVKVRNEGRDGDAMRAGYRAGYNFNPTKQINREAVAI